MKREPTEYKGVYFRQQKKLDSAALEKVFYIFYRRLGGDGKQIEERVGRESQGITAARASHIRADRIRGKDLPNVERRAAAAEAKKAREDRPEIVKLWEWYQKHKTGKPISTTDTGYYNKYLREPFAAKTPAEITTLDLDRLRTAMSKAGKAPQTIKHALGLLRRLIRFGAERGICDMPPQSQLRFIMPKVSNQKTENMTLAQLTAYLAALDAEADQHLAAILRLALFTGMRKSALLALRWPDIDFALGFILLRGETAKKGRAERIPMSAPVRAVLEALPRMPDTDYLFPGKGGGQRENFRRMAKRVRDKAGLPEDFRPMHGLRHTFASWLASSGEVDLYTLQKLLTHDRPEMTARYAHLADEALQRAATVAGNILKPKKRKGTAG